MTAFHGATILLAKHARHFFLRIVILGVGCVNILRSNMHQRSDPMAGLNSRCIVRAADVQLYEQCSGGSDVSFASELRLSHADGGMMWDTKRP